MRGLGNNSERSIRGGRIFRFDSFIGPLGCLRWRRGSVLLRGSELFSLFSEDFVEPAKPDVGSMVESRELKYENKAEEDPD